MRTVATALCFVLLVLAMPAVAQDAKAPTLSEVDALKLDKLLLRQQNLALQIQSLQHALQQANEEAPKLKAEVDQFVASLQKPGFALQADGKGGYVYVAVPKPADAEPKK